MGRDTHGLPDPARSRAVLVGAAEYEVLDDLPSVRNNVRRLAELLRGPDGWMLPEEHCVPLLDSSREEVFKAVSAAAAAAEDALLVYYAGHGLLAPDGTDALHLGLRGSHADELFFAVEYAPLRHLIMKSRARHRVVVLDCCFSGSAAGPYLNEPGGIADHAAIEGACLITATARTRLALAPADEPYTAFTGELVKVLEDGVPHGPRLLDLDTVFRQVWRELRAKDRPEPEQRSRNAGHRLVFARNRWTPAPTPEALRYAAALRDAYAAHPGRVSADSAAVERYLSGAWIAPREFVEELRPGPGAGTDRLHDLRRAAQRTAPDTETQLIHAREEGERLRAEVERLREQVAGLRVEALSLRSAEQDAAQDREESARQAAELSGRLASLVRQLAEERERAERIGRECHELQAAKTAQQRQLEHAGAYVRDLEEELAQLHRASVRDQDEIRRLRHEVGVLQRQLGLREREEEPAGGTARPGGRAAAVGAGRREGRAGSREEGAPSGPGARGDRPGTAGPRSTAPAGAPGEGLRVGCAALLFLVAVVDLVVASINASANAQVVFHSGRKPVTATSTSRYHSFDTHTWDVAQKVRSTFRPSGTLLWPGVGGVQGRLEVQVPKGCEGRTVRWRVEADGRRAESGVLRGKRSYRDKTDFSLSHRPHSVTLLADWDGGTSSCPSFALRWHDPRVDLTFDLFPF